MRSFRKKSDKSNVPTAGYKYHVRVSVKRVVGIAKGDVCVSLLAGRHKQIVDPCAADVASSCFPENAMHICTDHPFLDPRAATELLPVPASLYVQVKNIDPTVKDTVSNVDFNLSNYVVPKGASRRVEKFSLPFASQSSGQAPGDAGRTGWVSEGPGEEGDLDSLGGVLEVEISTLCLQPLSSADCKKAKTNAYTHVADPVAVAVSNHYEADAVRRLGDLESAKTRLEADLLAAREEARVKTDALQEHQAVIDNFEQLQAEFQQQMTVLEDEMTKMKVAKGEAEQDRNKFQEMAEALEAEIAKEREQFKSAEEKVQELTASQKDQTDLMDSLTEVMVEECQFMESVMEQLGSPVEINDFSQLADVRETVSKEITQLLVGKTSTTDSYTKVVSENKALTEELANLRKSTTARNEETTKQWEEERVQLLEQLEEEKQRSAEALQVAQDLREETEKLQRDVERAKMTSQSNALLSSVPGKQNEFDDDNGIKMPPCEAPPEERARLLETSLAKAMQQRHVAKEEAASLREQLEGVRAELEATSKLLTKEQAVKTVLAQAVTAAREAKKCPACRSAPAGNQPGKPSPAPDTTDTSTDPMSSRALPPRAPSSSSDVPRGEGLRHVGTGTTPRLSSHAATSPVPSDSRERDGRVNSADLVDAGTGPTPRQALRSPAPGTTPRSRTAEPASGTPGRGKGSAGGRAKSPAAKPVSSRSRGDQGGDSRIGTPDSALWDAGLDSTRNNISPSVGPGSTVSHNDNSNSANHGNNNGIPSGGLQYGDSGGAPWFQKAHAQEGSPKLRHSGSAASASDLNVVEMDTEASREDLSAGNSVGGAALAGSPYDPSLWVCSPPPPSHRSVGPSRAAASTPSVSMKDAGAESHDASRLGAVSLSPTPSSPETPGPTWQDQPSDVGLPPAESRLLTPDPIRLATKSPHSNSVTATPASKRADDAFRAVAPVRMVHVMAPTAASAAKAKAIPNKRLRSGDGEETAKLSVGRQLSSSSTGPSTVRETKKSLAARALKAAALKNKEEKEENENERIRQLNKKLSDSRVDDAVYRLSECAIVAREETLRLAEERMVVQEKNKTETTKFHAPSVYVPPDEVFHATETGKRLQQLEDSRRLRFERKEQLQREKELKLQQEVQQNCKTKKISKSQIDAAVARLATPVPRGSKGKPGRGGTHPASSPPSPACDEDPSAGGQPTLSAASFLGRANGTSSNLSNPKTVPGANGMFADGEARAGGAGEVVAGDGVVEGGDKKMTRRSRLSQEAQQRMISRLTATGAKKRPEDYPTPSFRPAINPLSRRLAYQRAQAKLKKYHEYLETGSLLGATDGDDDDGGGDGVRGHKGDAGSAGSEGLGALLRSLNGSESKPKLHRGRGMSDDGDYVLRRVPGVDFSTSESAGTRGNAVTRNARSEYGDAAYSFEAYNDENAIF
eukprot:Rmarinus@m.28740